MKKLSILLISLLALSLFVGCAKEEVKEGQKADTNKATLMLDWFPNTNHTGIYVAKEKGFYEAEGLDINIVQPPEGGTVQIIGAKKAEFGISYQEEVTNARSEEIPVKAIAGVIQHNTSGFASPMVKNIKTPKDLENKAYGGWGTPAETAMIKALMEKHDADFKKVKMINIGSADFFTSVQKDVDFSWIFYGWTGVEAELKGMDLNYISLNEEEPILDFYTPVIIINEDLEKENPALIKKFLKATSKGYEYAINNPEEAANILVAKVPELDKDLVIASQKYLSEKYQGDADKWGIMEEGRWENYAKWMFEQKLIAKEIDSSKAFTNEFLPKE
ncbi:ABC-type nitrate/sulfonate/bicarbonate transport system, substrate-binding protein [Desulfonispora thiosulfatigenes DSM 11270]|uniref:ABC-type nitrate/sulfonate/bicarbonate transport system, substrate-binding protein n=1 Tax=Desulfonispora thiosulfatigenes DSM 11270 TaxID=656914 RepID=A0A1W1VBQ6_DESTI|nr:ABC transporter substrate-binding protein [Desulfonispora thiosulfatigenes]SMB90726.1 ABC-type nitrate/sulfonate/bicarbonate transport system, substrate-binding protein [Desulfonispora thiosulfatigenes DSM 11270]